MGITSTALVINGAERRKQHITVPKAAYELWGKPMEVEIDHDVEAMALQVVIPPSAPIHSYKVSVDFGKARINCSAIRKEAPILGGRYEAISPTVFLHSTKLDQRPEAILLRRLVLQPDLFDSEASLERRRMMALVQAIYPETMTCGRGHTFMRSKVVPRLRGSSFQCVKCPDCPYIWWPTDETTVFTRGRKGINYVFTAMSYLMKNPGASYRDLGHLGIPHKDAFYIFSKLKGFMPPPVQGFTWTPYRNDTRPTLQRHIRVTWFGLIVVANIWEELGKPKRYNLFVDPVLATIKIQPDPNGAHAFSPKNLARGGRIAQSSTIRNLPDSIPIGLYDPVSVGRFEGVFKLRRNK